jgi:2-polyprenyl-3-methyl-5-hydroxy-6-metoxy-1,4-benzoquinol methylase
VLESDSARVYASESLPNLNNRMSPTHEQRLENEVVYHAEVAQRERENLVVTPPELVERYRKCARWRTYYPECVVHFLTKHQPEHICDFGCGSGEMACRLGLLGYRVTGLDVSPDLIEVARERAVREGVADRVTFVVADGASAPLTEGAFDAVLAMSVVHHMPIDEALNALERLLRPGGRIAFLEPVAYSRTLQWLRNRTPVEKDVSPDERQLCAAEIDHISERFIIEEQRHFLMVARLRRLLPEGWFRMGERVLSTLDQALFLIPGVSRFAGVIALLARKRD